MSASGAYQLLPGYYFSKETLEFCPRKQPWLTPKNESFNMAFVILTIVQANEDLIA
jgi:hypothetical protein